jgi:hypothetical protein
MSAPLLSFDITNSIDITDEIHIWRSKFLDVSARCETRLRQILELQVPNSDKFLQIKSLAATVKHNALGNSYSAKLNLTIDEFMPLIELRAELAHSVMMVINFNSELMAAFINANQRSSIGRRMLLLDGDQRECALKNIKRIANRLKQIHLAFTKSQSAAQINQPSKQKTPSP